MPVSVLSKLTRSEQGRTERLISNVFVNPDEAKPFYWLSGDISELIMKSLELKFRIRDIHKIRNFAEDLSLHLNDLGSLPMDEADQATDTVVVHDVHARQLRRCRAHVERFLKKHFLADKCDIVELNR